ncbi:MAG: rhomboid family intramembrane serine protease [Ectothiorhodospiraceae bacterium]|nr:rhomboid family intramembrane serine protease [Ectothiorhodospiraceae bacterium]
MLIIPYSAELSLAKTPVVTYVVIVLCLLIYIMQANNKEEIAEALQPFCNQIYDETLEPDDLDFLGENRSTCVSFLYSVHAQPDKDIIERWIKERNVATHTFTYEEILDVIEIAKEHHADFSEKAPASLDARLMYDPSSWGPITTITSALAHADWWHVLGNLIFFFAFAAAIETLLDNKFHYIGFMAMVALVNAVTYSASIAVINGPAIPSLGLSGVVMGVIGLAAYLMPKARIRTFIWVIIFFVRAFPMPAWILAAWFIGWDAYNLMMYSDHGGVNLIAHVSGGFAGYFYGFFFLKGRREMITDELNEEIQFRKNTRKNIFSNTNSYRGGDKCLQQTEEKDAKREYAKYSQKLYRYVNVGSSHEAIVLFLKEYDHYKDSIEIYEELFNDIEGWKKCRALMCLGRLIINLHLEKNNKKEALTMAQRCLNIQEDFVFADPKEALNLALYAMECQRYPLAHQIINRADLRYGESIDLIYSLLLEAQLLLLHLDKRDEAKVVLKRLIDKKPMSYRKDIASLIKVYKHG